MVSLLPLGAGPQQVLCLGTACTISAMSSTLHSSKVGWTIQAPAVFRDGELPSFVPVSCMFRQRKAKEVE